MEVVIASSISLMVLTGAGMTVANTQKAVNNAIASDTATSLALAVLEESVAFGCALATDPSSLSSISATSKCAAVLGGVESAGDAEFQATDAEGRPYTIRMTSRWRQANSQNACRSTSAATVGRSQVTRPQILERTAMLTWKVDGVARTKSYTKLQAAPTGSDFQAPNLGGIIVFAPEGTITAIAVGDDRIPRYATPCTGGVGAAAAWFPYLPPGTYNIQSGTGATATVTVDADETVEVLL